MEKINAKPIVYALLQLLLMQFSSLAEAVDLNYYPRRTFCTGTALGCYDIRSGLCCNAAGFNFGSLFVETGGMAGVFSLAYVGGGFANGGCALNAGAGTGPRCYSGLLFTGSKWCYVGRRSLLADNPSCGARRRSLLADNATCEGQMEPNSVFYTEESGKGHWTLATPNVTQVYTEMQTVAEAEKANWLKSRGAFHS